MHGIFYALRNIAFKCIFCLIAFIVNCFFEGFCKHRYSTFGHVHHLVCRIKQNCSLKTLDDQGVNLVAGTDSPIFPYGLALVIELQGYVDAGLTPAAALLFPCAP